MKMPMPMKIEPIEGSETSAFKTKTPGNSQKKTYYKIIVVSLNL